MLSIQATIYEFETSPCSNFALAEIARRDWVVAPPCWWKILIDDFFFWKTCLRQNLVLSFSCSMCRRWLFIVGRNVHKYAKNALDATQPTGALIQSWFARLPLGRVGWGGGKGWFCSVEPVHNLLWLLCHTRRCNLCGLSSLQCVCWYLQAVLRNTSRSPCKIYGTRSTPWTYVE